MDKKKHANLLSFSASFVKKSILVGLGVKGMLIIFLVLVQIAEIKQLIN